MISSSHLEFYIKFDFLHFKHALTTLFRRLIRCCTDVGHDKTHINLNLFPVRILNCWVITFNPNILDELRWNDVRRYIVTLRIAAPYLWGSSFPRRLDCRDCQLRCPSSEKCLFSYQHPRRQYDSLSYTNLVSSRILPLGKGYLSTFATSLLT